MKAKLGLYHVLHNKGSWCVYVYTQVADTFNSSNFVDSFPFFEDAITEMYKLNGWGKPKNIVKRF